MPGSEINLLFLLARKIFDENHKERVFQIIEGGVDWKLFFDLVDYHRVFPLVFLNLSQYFPGSIPDYLIQTCKIQVRNSGIKSLSFFSYLLEVVSLLSANNITIIPFKGPLLAGYLYNDIALRTYNDLDVLIDRKDLPEVYDLLLVNGYVPELEIEPVCLNAYSRLEDNLSFKKENGLVLEVHWELSGRFLSVPFEYQLVKQRCHVISVLKRDFTSISDEDLLVYLCLHGTKHNWVYYELIVCVGALIEKCEINWKHVVKRAEYLKCRRALLVSLVLVQKMYGRYLPEFMEEMAEQDIKIVELAEAIEQHLRTSEIARVADDPRYNSFRFSVKDNLLEQVKSGCRLMFFPSKREWKLFKIPNTFFVFLYWIIRPFRIGREIVIKQFNVG